MFHSNKLEFDNFENNYSDLPEVLVIKVTYFLLTSRHVNKDAAQLE